MARPRKPTALKLVEGNRGKRAVALDLNRRLARSQSVIPRTVGLFSLGYGEMTRGPGWRQVPMNQIGHDGLAECAR